MKKITILMLGIIWCTAIKLQAQVTLASGVKATYHESIREQVANFYGEVLGAEVISSPNGVKYLDAIIFNDDTKLNIVYTDDKKKVLSDKKAYNGLWIQLNTQNFDQIKTKVTASGVKLLPEFNKEDKFYFQAPGGQVIRLMNTAKKRDGRLTSEEIAFAEKHLKDSRDRLWNEIKNLTESQWNFKIDTSTWSIAQIAEHIARAENIVKEKQVGVALMSDSQPDKISGAVDNMENVLSIITNRSRKFPAAPGTVPESKWKTPKEFMDEFDKIRNSTINFIKNSNIPMRAHHTKPNRFLGDMDAYNWLVFISGHTLRHIEQIQEVKGDNQYASL